MRAPTETSAGSTADPQADVLRFLQTPQAHGVARADLSWTETHMSWVFLTPTQVLKLKKAVRTRYLDHSSLQRRERDCREELRLNARLAPDVYLGLAAVQRTPHGLCLVPDGTQAGSTVDWLVRMRRLPESVRLDRRIACGQVDTPEIEALGTLLARFYRGAAARPTSAAEYVEQFRHEQRINREVLLEPRWVRQHASQALDLLDTALEEQAPALGARAAGHLVDGHGDLRPEHVFLLDPPAVIDCLEFDERLRRVDPYDEIAFLGLECDIGGAPWIGPVLHRHLVAALGGEPPATVRRIHVAARALLRARLALAHLADEAVRDGCRWRALADRYLEYTLRLWWNEGWFGPP